MTGSPPLIAGADHDTTNDPSRPTTDTINGTDGACATNGTTGNDPGDNPLDPPAFVADTCAAYATPAHNPPTNAAELELLTDTKNGPAHPPDTDPCPDTATTCTEYELTASDAASGTHDTNNPKPSATTPVTAGTSATETAADRTRERARARSRPRPTNRA